LSAVLPEAELVWPPPREVVRGPKTFRAAVAARRDRVWHAMWSGLAQKLAVFVAWASIAERAAALRKAMQVPAPGELEISARVFDAWALSCYLNCNDTIAAAPSSESLCARTSCGGASRGRFRGAISRTLIPTA